MLHNHPGQSGFSLNGLKMFIGNKSIQTTTIVTNYSVVTGTYTTQTLPTIQSREIQDDEATTKK
ncbi:hypothetical protein GF557_12730 [Staphylococcus aureus]|uniref:hypothetical protein n=1 Tax=Staphylococcus aureus TaxID=1280 RepID=UPI0012B10504|nr:hypothetical protein [Staphylococcus aureus]MRV98027.1 hypothetical protein [Staphylococcus aureus]